MIEENKIELEQEMDMPENWVSNRILVRDGRGLVVELVTPDDEEENINAADD